MDVKKLFKIELSENRIFGLDILRFVAIFMVLLGHSCLLLPESVKKVLGKYIYDGVGIFFVLSGFLIGGILIKSLEKNKPSFPILLDFWKRRWLRTLPAYFLVLIFLLVYTFFVTSYAFPNDWFRFFFFTQNIFGYHRPSFFAEAWSLSVEEWFYMFIPLIFFCTLILMKKQVKWTIISVSLLIVILVTYYRYYLFFDFNLPASPNPYQIKLFKNLLNYEIVYQVIPRLDSIMFGVIAAFCAFYYPKFWNFRFNIVLLVIGCLLLWHCKFHHGKSYGEYNNIWCPSLKSLAVALMLPFLSNLKKGLGIWTHWVTFISLISYSLYLINLNVVYRIGIKHFINGNYSPSKLEVGSNWILNYLLFWVLSIGLAYLIYIFIEVPFMKMRQKK